MDWDIGGRDVDVDRGVRTARGADVSTDERESQLSAMFDGELPDSECELLARRLSRDPSLQQQWSRYALIGAVIRDEPLHARRAPGGRVAAGIAARLASAIEAEEGAAAAGLAASAVEAGAGPPAVADAQAAVAARARWIRPVAGLGVAAGVAALSVFWLQARAPQDVPAGIAQLEPAAVREVDVIAPPAATRGAAAEIVVAGNGYPAPAERASGSGEPESYVVPLPTERRGVAPPAQLANYVVAHSEYSAPLSRRSLLSALVAADASVAADEAPAAGAPPVPAAASAPGEGEATRSPPAGLRSAEAPK